MQRVPSSLDVSRSARSSTHPVGVPEPWTLTWNGTGRPYTTAPSVVTETVVGAAAGSAADGVTGAAVGLSTLLDPAITRTEKSYWTSLVRPNTVAAVAVGAAST